jgi:hypothetical protein
MTQVLLDDGEADFSLTADIPSAGTARVGSYLGAINGHKTKVRGMHGCVSLREADEEAGEVEKSGACQDAGSQ